MKTSAVVSWVLSGFLGVVAQCASAADGTIASPVPIVAAELTCPNLTEGAGLQAREKGVPRWSTRTHLGQRGHTSGGGDRKITDGCLRTESVADDLFWRGNTEPCSPRTVCWRQPSSLTSQHARSAKPLWLAPVIIYSKLHAPHATAKAQSLTPCADCRLVGEATIR